jgi:hypothetical protein
MHQLLYLEGKSPSAHWKGGWVSPRIVLDVVAKRKNSCPCQKSNPNHPAHELVTIMIELSPLIGDMCLQKLNHLAEHAIELVTAEDWGCYYHHVIKTENLY